jgi:transcription antitermination factor NusA-like protein
MKLDHALVDDFLRAGVTEPRLALAIEVAARAALRKDGLEAEVEVDPGTWEVRAGRGGQTLDLSRLSHAAISVFRGVLRSYLKAPAASLAEGALVSGVVEAASPRGITVMLAGGARAFLPRQEEVESEALRPGERARFVAVGTGLVSRRRESLVRRLLELEVPEVGTGEVEVMAMAREPGVATKVAVRGRGIDPVGAVLGEGAMRARAVSAELRGEKLEVVEWSDDPEVLAARAVAPARAVGAALVGDRVEVLVPASQLASAVGKGGLNAQLASRLLGRSLRVRAA